MITNSFTNISTCFKQSNNNKITYSPAIICSGQSNNISNQYSINIQDILVLLNNYTPVSQNIQFQELKKSRYLVTKKYKQAVYFGQCKDNKKNGMGIMLYTNGRVYQGQWCDNFKSGKGFQKFQNRSIYEGSYSKGKPQGFGKYQWPNGQLYQGQWINGLKNGSGIWRGPKGDSYIGEWKDGTADGYGVHTWINGDRYEGEFKNCLKHGQGVQKFANGDIYKGFYQNGKPSGYGQYYWSTGSFFKGNFNNGMRDGNGVWKRGPGNSDKYEGQYRNDKKQGYGVYTWGNGNIYKGNYQNDLRQGYGEMYWIDGTSYKGLWSQGAQQSQPRNNQFNETEDIKNHKNIKQNVLISETSDFYQQKPKNYCQPERPSILQKTKKQFRARGLTSHKSSRQKPYLQTPQSKIYLNTSFNQQPRLNKKYSMGTKMDLSTKKKIPPHNNREHQMMSASFFLYKIHKQAESQPSTTSFISNVRASKTSGGFRHKKIADQINYFTKSKLNNAQEFF